MKSGVSTPPRQDAGRSAKGGLWQESPSRAPPPPETRSRAEAEVEGNRRSGRTAPEPAHPLGGYAIPFDVTSDATINLVFANLGGDNLGALLDNVVLERLDQPGVPDGGASALLLGMSLLAIGAGRRLAK